MTDPTAPAAPPMPAWLPCAQLPATLPAWQRDWLLDEGSLTRRLTDAAAGAFAVRRQAEGWQALRADECAALALPEGTQGWVREVLLCGRDQPWVFARSVAARDALEAAGFTLDTLGERSLGELLFQDRAFVRGPLELCRYPAAWLPGPVREAGLWARRSCFRRDGLPLLVAEVFLPTLWRATGALR